MKNKLNLNQLSTVATTVVIMLIIYLSPVSTNALTQYGINATTTGGGKTISYEADLLSPDNSYVLEAHAENGYAFDHWDIEGSCSFNFCTTYDSTINITLYSNCKAKAYFKSTCVASKYESSTNKSYFDFFGFKIPVVNAADNKSYTVVNDENKEDNSFSYIIVTFCIVVIVVILVLHLFNHGKLSFTLRYNDNQKQIEYDPYTFFE